MNHSLLAIEIFLSRHQSCSEGKGARASQMFDSLGCSSSPGSSDAALRDFIWQEAPYSMLSTYGEAKQDTVVEREASQNGRKYTFLLFLMRMHQRASERTSEQHERSESQYTFARTL
jgi:hypothetical protein